MVPSPTAKSGFISQGEHKTEKSAQTDLDTITGASGVVIQDGTIVAASLGADCITAAKVADDVHA